MTSIMCSCCSFRSTVTILTLLRLCVLLNICGLFSITCRHRWVSAAPCRANTSIPTLNIAPVAIHVSRFTERRSRGLQFMLSSSFLQVDSPLQGMNTTPILAAVSQISGVRPSAVLSTCSTSLPYSQNPSLQLHMRFWVRLVQHPTYHP